MAKSPVEAALEDEDYSRDEQWRLYEAYNELHGLAQELETSFDAPAVLVVGHQTDGKSALVEALMGFHMKYGPTCELPLCSLLSEADPSSARLMSLQEIQAFIEYADVQIDYELSRTVVVSTKLDTKIPQFARSSDVEVFLSPPACTLDGFILGDSPLFTSVPSGRVGE